MIFLFVAHYERGEWRETRRAHWQPAETKMRGWYAYEEPGHWAWWDVTTRRWKKGTLEECVAHLWPERSLWYVRWWIETGSRADRRDPREIDWKAWHGRNRQPVLTEV